MSPFIRWRVIPETENTGRAKRTLNVLLWLPHLTKSDLAALDQVQILREYLLSMKPPICAINLLVPVSFVETAKTLTDFLVPIVPARESQTDQNILDVLGRASPDGMAEALSTALSCPADVLVVGDTGWFRYFREFEKFNVLIADTTVLLRQCEIFVRGHETPWSFEYMVWNEPWTEFYVLSETTTFRDGLRYLDLAHKKGLDPGTQDTAMMKLDEEPTEEDLDKEIGQLGLDRDLAYFPEGPIRDWAKSLLRYKVRLSKHKEIAEGVVLIEIKDKWGFIIPMDDIEWNVQKFHNFMTKVLRACEKAVL